MAAKRIYEIAKDYRVSSEAMMAIIKKLKFAVKSHMSTVSEEMLKAIEAHFQKEKERVKKEYELKRKKIEEREKAVIAPPPKVELPVPPKPPLQPVAAKPAMAQPQVTEKPKIVIPAPPRPIYRPIEQKKPRPRPEQQKPLVRTVDRQAVEASFKRTLADLAGRRKLKRPLRHEQEDEGVIVETAKKIRINEYMTVAELATAMELRPAQIITKCLELGMMASINQRLDLDTIGTLALEFGYETEVVKEIGAEEITEQEEEGEALPRPPVVTIMGHVDHGKTSLLDYIRKSNIIAGESGGITQHIGAYEVELPTGKITFLDTPGHEAFTAMRARGAQITDLVILVVAADDGVMPQTVEAIDHARAAGVPIIVAVNKIDLPGATPEQIRQQLSKHNLVPEEWGGNTIMVDISAKSGKHVDKLLEMILLQSELLELKANPFMRAQGTIIEAKLDRGKGSVATVLVQKGTLRIGDPFVCGSYYGKVRALFDERGHPREECGPSTPVLVLGAGGVPQAGDSFIVTADEAQAREISAKRMQVKREQEFHRLQTITLSDVYQQIKEGIIKELRVVIKADVDGSAEVLSEALSKIGTPEVHLNVIHRGVGPINESDVLLAAASQAIIIGFHVRPEPRARDLATKQRVDIRLYTIIYEAEQEIKKALEGMLEPEKSEKVNASVEVRELFRVPKVGIVAGCYVQNGQIKRTDRVRVIRDGLVVYDGVLGSLRRFKDDVREVQQGYECGIRIENFNDLKKGDVLEAYEVTELARKLE